MPAAANFSIQDEESEIPDSYVMSILGSSADFAGGMGSSGMSYTVGKSPSQSYTYAASSLTTGAAKP